MKINYEITESSLKNIQKYTWLKEHFDISKLGTKDDREIIRLLEHSHEPHIEKCLQLINNYGSLSKEIGETLLNSNDILSFTRTLSELFFFVYLFEKIGSDVKAVRRINGQKTPDISVKINDFELLIEIYSPMDYFGYQTFSKLISQSLMNLNIDFGFDITIRLVSKNFFFAHDFPDFKEIYDWISQFEENVIDWLSFAEAGKSFATVSPAASAKLITTLNKRYEDVNNRSITYNEPTRSTDTKLIFEIDDPSAFSKNPWGIKIKDKLQRQQAGEKKDGVIRILAINFSHCDTSDIGFFNIEKYYNNLEKDIKFLVADIKPHPPYDIVLPCELRFSCGFIKPINLSDFDDSIIGELISKTGLDHSLEEIPKASKEEIDEIIRSFE